MQDPEIVPIPSPQANHLKWTGLPTIPPCESQVQKRLLLLSSFSKETPICSSRTCSHPQSCYLLSHLRGNGSDSRTPCPEFLLPSYPDLPLPLTIEISSLAETLPTQWQRLTPLLSLRQVGDTQMLAQALISLQNSLPCFQLSELNISTWMFSLLKCVRNWIHCDNSKQTLIHIKSLSFHKWLLYLFYTHYPI